MDTMSHQSENTEDRQGQEQKLPFYINRNFALLFSGYTISIVGDVVFSATLSLWVALVIAKDQPWAPLALGGVLIALLVPTLLLGSLAGVFVDRWVKRTTMLRMDAIRAVLVLLFLPLSGFVPLPFTVPVPLTLAVVYAVVFLNGICSQFFNPSSFALTADIVPDKYRARATGLQQAASSLAFIVAPSLAVPLFFSLGIQVAILINAISFTISFLAVLAIRVPGATTSLEDGEKGNFLREYFAGLAFIGRNKVLLVAILGAFLAVIPEGAQDSLGIFFYQANLNAPLDLFGLMASANGIGGIAGAVLAALFAQRLGVTRVFSGGLLLAGVLMMLYSRTTWLPPALVCVFLTGLLVAMVNVVVGPMALSVTPKKMLGRVSATATSTLSLGSLLSVSVLSALASTVLVDFKVTIANVKFGTYDTIFAFTAIIAIAGGIFAFYHLWKVKLVMPEDDENKGKENADQKDVVVTADAQPSEVVSPAISH